MDQYRVTGVLTAHNGWRRKGDVSVSIDTETIVVDEVVAVETRHNAKMAAWHKVLRQSGRSDGYWHQSPTIELLPNEIKEAPEDQRLRAIGAPELPGLKEK
jgi:hypothetical protein